MLPFSNTKLNIIKWTKKLYEINQSISNIHRVCLSNFKTKYGGVKGPQSQEHASQTKNTF